MRTTPDRADVVDILAALGDRDPEAVPENIDSLELAWLVHQAEQRYAVVLDLDDHALLRMRTVSGAVEVLTEAIAGSSDG